VSDATGAERISYNGHPNEESTDTMPVAIRISYD